MSFAAAFLREPDLFPARRSGERWGGESVTIDFAAGPYRFEGLSPQQAATVRERFRDRITAAGEDRSATTTPVFRAAATDFVEIDPRGWEWTLDLDHQPDAVRMAGRGFVARLDWRPELAGALWTAVEGPLFQELFENYFRILAAYRLAERGGALLHSAGIVDDGEAFVFFGRSGAGKSTISRLALGAGRLVLSDDLNAVCSADRRAVVEKVPFAGDLGRTSTPSESYPLRALLALEKGAESDLRPVSSGRTLAALLASAPYLNRDPHRLELLTANLERLIGDVETGVLTFDLGGSFWHLLRPARQAPGAPR